MGQRSCQCQALGLTAGKAGAAGADDGIHTVFHGQHFAVQRGGSKPRHGILFTAAENIVLHCIGAQLRIVAQVTNGGGDLPRGQGSKFRFAKFCRATVGCFAQEHPAEGGFAAGHRAGDANDIARVRRQAQAGKDGSFAIGKERFSSVTSCAAGIFNASSCSGCFISSLMRFHETSAFCTELNSFATLEDLTTSFVKQERKVVNAAMSHVLQPEPSTF